MANGDIISCVVNADGWTVDITVEGVGVGGSYDFGLGSDNDPSTAKIVLSLTSEGYDNTPSLGTLARTVYGVPDINVGAVRLPDPNETSPDETVSGADVVIRVALSEYIYDDDVSITVDIGAGWYTQGGTPSNVETGLSVTNNSTKDYTIPSMRFATANCQVVTGNFIVEIISFHRHATGGKPLACVVATATDEHANSDTDTITDMTISAQPGDQQPVLCYSFPVDTSGMTDGDLITIEAQMYPWVGDADSVLDTDDGSYSIPTAMWTNLVFRLDKGDTHGKTVVDPGGNDGTGAVYSTELAAESGNAFLTIPAALTAVQAYNNANAGHNDAGGGTLLLGEASWPLNTSNGGALTQWVTMKPRSGASKSNVLVNPAANSSRMPLYTKFEGVTVDTTFFYRGHDVDCPWWDDCGVSFNSGINLSIYQTPYAVMTRCTGDMASNSFNTFGANDTAWTLIRGNHMDDLEFGHLHCCVGNINVGLSMRLNNSNDLHELGVYAFNVCQPANFSDFTIQLADTAIDTYTLGFAIVQSLLVRYTNNAQSMVRISADGSVTNTNNILLMYNTVVGARCNVGYNDSVPVSGPYPQTLWKTGGNIFTEWNNKDDSFGNNPNGIGGWSVGYNVGSIGNVFGRPSTTDEWLGEFQGLHMKKGTVASPLDPLFVDDQSFDGGDTSGGDYHLDTGSPAIALWDDYFLPYDLEGNPRSSNENAGVYVSAIAYVKVISDFVGITDSISLTAGYVKSLSDTVGITDAISSTVGYVKSLSDTVGITDTFSRIGTYIKTISDTAGIADSFVRVVTYVRSISNTVGITDFLPPIVDTVVKIAKIIGKITKYLIYAEGEHMEIKKGNTMILGFALKDGDGSTITTLSSATSIIFQLKSEKTGSALIEKSVGSGITIDTDKLGNSVVGSIRIEASATDIDALTAGSELFIAVEVEWTDNTQEIYIKEDTTIIDMISVNQDIILS